MGDHKHSGKIAVNRHQVQSKDAASRQERAIEKVTRQAAREEIHAQTPVCGGCGGPAGFETDSGEPVCWGCININSHGLFCGFD